jgi:type IV secretion system protein TrbI
MPDTVNEKQQPAVVDKRSMPPGVVKKALQSWVIIGLIVLMMLVMWLSGGNKTKNTPPQGPPSTETKPANASTSTDDYARHLEETQRQQQQQNLAAAAGRGANVTNTNGSSSPSAYNSQSGAGAEPAPTPDPVADDLKKRTYTSLYSSSVALSYRQSDNHPANALPPQPTLEQLAAAIPGLPIPSGTEPTANSPLLPPAQSSSNAPGQTGPAHKAIPANANLATGKDYTVFEGTLFETVLVNRLDGDFSGPVMAMVTTDVYSHDRQHLLISAGSKLLGESKQVDSFGQRRLAVFFHRLIMPDGFSLDLDRFQGLSQVGETGLKDKVNNHYFQIFGASLAVGAVGGLAQLGTNSGAAGVPQSSLDTYRQGVAASVSQSSLHILDQFLNVLPTITIREGHRVKVYITQDLLVPDYAQHAMPSNL